MSREKYFLTDDASGVTESIVSPDYVVRAYSVVSPGEKTRRVLGVLKDGADVPESRLSIEIENVLYDFGSEPNLISIFSLERYASQSDIGKIIGSLNHKNDGIYCSRDYRYKSGHIKHDLKCRLVKASTSRNTEPANRMTPGQYVVLEFSGKQTSAKKYSDILQEKMGRNGNVVKSNVFCVLGGNLKQTIKSMPAQ